MNKFITYPTLLFALFLLMNSCANQQMALRQKPDELRLAQATEKTVSHHDNVELSPVETAGEPQLAKVATDAPAMHENKMTAEKAARKEQKNDKTAKMIRKLSKTGKDISLAPLVFAGKATKSIKAKKKKTVLGGLLKWALIFLIVAIVAAVLGFGALADTAAAITQVLFVIFLILFLLFLILHLLG